MDRMLLWGTYFKVKDCILIGGSIVTSKLVGRGFDASNTQASTRTLEALSFKDVIIVERSNNSLEFDLDVEHEYHNLNPFLQKEGYMGRVQAAALRRMLRDFDFDYQALAKALGLETWDLSRIMRIRWIYSPFQMTDFWDEHYIFPGPENDCHTLLNRMVETVQEVGTQKAAEIFRVSVERFQWMISQEYILTPYLIEDFSWFLPLCPSGYLGTRNSISGVKLIERQMIFVGFGLPVQRPSTATP